MEFPGSQLLLQLMVLQEQPSQPPLQAGAGRNTVLNTKDRLGSEAKNQIRTTRQLLSTQLKPLIEPK
jgi:hypothetical protein